MDFYLTSIHLTGTLIQLLSCSSFRCEDVDVRDRLLNETLYVPMRLCSNVYPTVWAQ